MSWSTPEEADARRAIRHYGDDTALMADNPATRARRVTAAIANENAKLPAADANGRPVKGFHTTGPTLSGHPVAVEAAATQAMRNGQAVPATHWLDN